MHITGMLVLFLAKEQDVANENWTTKTTLPNQIELRAAQILQMERKHIFRNNEIHQ
jgi:hypothetical protein